MKLSKLKEKNLTVEQQAKYLLFNIRFMKDLREKIDRARRLYRDKIMRKGKYK